MMQRDGYMCRGCVSVNLAAAYKNCSSNWISINDCSNRRPWDLKTGCFLCEDKVGSWTGTCSYEKQIEICYASVPLSNYVLLVKILRNDIIIDSFIWVVLTACTTGSSHNVHIATDSV